MSLLYVVLAAGFFTLTLALIGFFEKLRGNGS